MAATDVDLRHGMLSIDGEPLAGRLLPSLLAALLESHGEGGATVARPCRRVALRDHIGGLPDLHRTQLWRALRALRSTALDGLVGHATASAGPFWLDEGVLARCRFTVEGEPATPGRLAAFLRPSRTASPVAAGTPVLPSLAYVEALSQADYLLDRGELYPARRQLDRARAHLADDALAERAAIAVRRARIARRLGDWAALQDDLRELGGIVASPRIEPHERRQLSARILILTAWHLHGSLGNARTALARLDEVEPSTLAADLALRNDYLNLRGMVLRELSLGEPDAALAPTRSAEAVGCFGEAIRCAALAGNADQLQVTAANLGNSLCLLHEAGLLTAGADRAPGGQEAVRQAIGWLLLSDAICTRWQIATRSLLNTIFLLRLAAVNELSFCALAAQAAEQGQALAAAGYGELAAQAWESRRAVHSQIPVEQRCAFFLVWATHAAREGRFVDCAELCRRVAHEARKLRDETLRRSYEDELARLRAELAARTTLKRA